MVFQDSDSIPGKDFKIPKDVKILLDTKCMDAQYESRLETAAVVVQKANKTYGKGHPILDNFTMTVERGNIYGLLGSSGCGKTTILSSIVGLKKLDSGEIKVFGAVPGTKESGIPGKTIGYMPQEIALYQIFTIKEILQYFGRIYGMTQSEIQARMEFLLNFLDLPDCFRRISELSGGQQRRTSLAVAMIHQPDLLILDEPTVGVDPLVRESIWEYLGEIVAKRKTTVIITTHYIEEARQSHMIGLMRNGRLLTEKPPLALLEEHNATLLEDIVLKLCKKDTLMNADSKYMDEVAQAISETSFYSHKQRSTFAQVPVFGLSYKSRSPDDLTILRSRRSRVDQSICQNFRYGLSSHINKIKSLTIKNFLTLLRYPLFLAAFLFIPALQIILFNFIVGTDPKHTVVGVVNNEFQSTDYLETCVRNPVSCFNDKLSCNFLNTFDQENVIWIVFTSEKDALENVQQGNSLGYISIPANFTNNLKDRFLLRNFATNESLIGSDIAARLDMSFSIKGTFIQTLMYKHYLEFVQSVVSDCGGDPRTVELPMHYNPIYGILNGGLLEFMQPAQILLIIILLPMSSSVSYVWEKKAGTLDRSMVAGVEFYHFLAALIISEGFMIFIELVLCFGVLLLAFDFNIKGSVLLGFLLCFLQGICGLSFGFLFGTLWESEIEVMISILAIYLPVLTSSGGTWPLESVNIWFRPFCNFLPATFSIEAIRSIVSRGWGITHPHVWTGFASVICWTFFCCFLSVVVHRMRK